MAGVFPDSGVPANQALNSVNVPTTGCGGDTGELFHSTNRCTPRFDPAAANAVMSEILNVVNCAGNTYNCARLDNLCLAIRELIDDELHDCIPTAFPSATGCTIQYLVLSTDAAGCRRIAVYNEEDALLATTGTCSVWPVGNRNLPADPTNPNTYYTTQDLSADVVGGTIDESKLTPNILAQMVINVPCPNMQIEFELSGSVVFEPNANGGDGRASAITVRVDGDFPLSANQIVPRLARFTNFESQIATTSRLVLSQGAHTLQFYVISQGVVDEPARMTSNCAANGSGSFSVRARIAAN